MSSLGKRCVGHYYVSVRCAPDERAWSVSMGKVGTDTHRSAYQNYVGDEPAYLGAVPPPGVSAVPCKCAYTQFSMAAHLYAT